MDEPSTAPLEQTNTSRIVWPITHKFITLSFVPEKVFSQTRSEEEKEQLYQEMIWLTKVMDRFKIEKNYNMWNNNPIKWYSCEEIKNLSLFDVADVNDLYYEWSQNKWSFSNIERQLANTIFKKKMFLIIKHFLIGFFIGRCLIFFINLFQTA